MGYSSSALNTTLLTQVGLCAVCHDAAELLQLVHHDAAKHAVELDVQVTKRCRLLVGVFVTERVMWCLRRGLKRCQAQFILDILLL